MIRLLWLPAALVALVAPAADAAADPVHLPPIAGRGQGPFSERSGGGRAASAQRFSNHRESPLAPIAGLHRAVGAVSPGISFPSPAGPPGGRSLPRWAVLGGPSAGVPPTRLRTAAAKPDGGERFAAMFADVRPFLVPGLGGLGALAVASGWLLWRRRVAVHRLPEFAVEPRLGGDHAAGIGGVISFADPTLPPSAQHRLRPDSFSLP